MKRKRSVRVSAWMIAAALLAGTALAEGLPPDVPEGHWAAGAIRALDGSGLLMFPSETGNRQYLPARPGDPPADHWARDAVAMFAETGIMTCLWVPRPLPPEVLEKRQGVLFSDVPRGHWAAGAIRYLAARGWL